MNLKPAFDSSVRFSRPWKQNIDTAVPWEARTFAFRLVDGFIGVVHEKWVVARDAHGDRAKVTKISGQPLSDKENPKLTYEQVDSIFKDAEVNDDPLRVSYGRVMGLANLTGTQVERLATCPDCYVAFPVAAVVQTTDLTAAKVEAYKASVSKAPEISRRVRVQQAQTAQ